MDGENAHALIRTGPTAKVMRVRIGDDIGGWKVGQIEAQRLVLLLDGRTATFTIFAGVNNRPANSGANAQSPTERGANSATQASSPSSNNSTASNPATARVKRPHPRQQ
jgi:hypothetical protein